MKKAITLLAMGLLASNTFAGTPNKVCQNCHPTIYHEFQSSMHKKSSIYNDPVHKAIWDKHPLKAKEKYTCAKCHTPSDKKLLANLENGDSALPRENDEMQEEGISCVSCHTIESIEEHHRSNNNLASTVSIQKRQRNLDCRMREGSTLFKC